MYPIYVLVEFPSPKFSLFALQLFVFELHTISSEPNDLQNDLEQYKVKFTPYVYY